MRRRSSAEIRREVGHPIVDVDGHMLEVLDAAHPHLRESLGPELFEQWRKRRIESSASAASSAAPHSPTLEERRRSRSPQGSWWGGAPAGNVRDRATAALPAMLCERMDELGFDYTVLYPTNTLLTCAEGNPDMRRGLCAGYNSFYADVYGDYAERLTPAGIIPMHTPEEAVAELNHCRNLGLKVVCFPEGVLRPLESPAPPDCSPWLFPGQTHWFDSFGLDSAYDYDPVWSACQELGFVATFHGGLTVRPGIHWSISSYVANHVGQFMLSMYQLCKSLVFGGVPRRFPDLPIVFLECGVSWAVQMLLDTIEHWEKRNLEAIRNLDPSILDLEALAGYYRRYGGRLAELAGEEFYERIQRLPVHSGAPEELDEFVHMQVGSPGDIAHLFSRSLYFGCEADDRGIATAFSAINPPEARLKPLLSSDIGHWDVTDMARVVSESYELVEDGYLTPEQWREVVFENPVEMYRRTNPHFFDGTPVAKHLSA